MAKLNLLILWVSFATGLVSCWNRNDFPKQMTFAQELAQPPIQEKIEKPPFEINFKDVRYQVNPLFDYELFGLVVSYQHHNGNTMLHKLWNDHLNTSDVCVLWSDSAFSPLLNELTFWNGQFTCNIKTRNHEAWDSISMDQLSNNHLLTEDPYLRDDIRDLQIGDQIRIRGWLASYSNEHGGRRGTSTVRTDSGNGACETIYVTDFEVLKPVSGGWRGRMPIAFAICLLSLIMYFRQPFQARH